MTEKLSDFKKHPTDGGFWWFYSHEEAAPICCYLRKHEHGYISVVETAGPIPAAYLHQRDLRFVDTGYWRKIDNIPTMPRYRDLLES